MITVSNTTAITTLLKVGRPDLLHELFGQVWIPPAVNEELRQHHPSIPEYFQLHTVADSDRLRHIVRQVDRGEAEAICLAMESNADILLIDDKKGRQLAEAHGLNAWGCQSWRSRPNVDGFYLLSATFSTLWKAGGTFVYRLEPERHSCEKEASEALTMKRVSIKSTFRAG